MIENYFKNYHNYPNQILFEFTVGHGGVGDYVKFFTFLLNYCIKNNIKMYCTRDKINQYIELLHPEMYLCPNNMIKEKIIKLNTYNVTFNNSILYVTDPSSMYDLPNHYENMEIVSQIFYFTPLVIAKAENITKNKSYVSVHLRLGDYYLETDKNFIQVPQDRRFFNETKLLNFINDIQTIEPNIYFFCDNNQYKLKLKSLYHCIQSTELEIGHTSLQNTTREQFFNAVVEYYILSKSKTIYYASESGFPITASKFNNTKLIKL